MTFHLSNLQHCPIWGTEATIRSLDPMWYGFNSARAGGEYVIHKQAEAELPRISDEVKARLTTILVDKRKLGEVPHVTIELLDEAKAKETLLVYERAERLLGELIARPHKVGDTFLILLGGRTFDQALAVPESTNQHFPLDRALAVSESMDYAEIQYFLCYLEERKWVKIYDTGAIEITVDGYARAQAMKANQNSSQAFIAMWLNKEVEAAYREGIVPAIQSCGYKDFRIGDDPKLDKIDDAIIGEIRRSRFMVADFTYGDDGIRGSVYYEAGFAQGLGIPVIRSCRSDQISDLHFDIRQYYHIDWDNPKGLKFELKKRIFAIVGEGPNVSES